MWGIVPAAGIGSRIQPLAFSKELLPVGSRFDGKTERPRAVSEYLVERMLRAGVTNICFVISPGKTDIIEYFGANVGSAHVVYTVQPRPAGLCDAIFRAVPLIYPKEHVVIGLPDTVWFPTDGFCQLPDNQLGFLLFLVAHPELFDSVVTHENGSVLRIDVKTSSPETQWIWGAFKMTGAILHELFELWSEKDRQDEYFGTLVNAYLARGGKAVGSRTNGAYVDIGTVHGYREAVRILCPEEWVARADGIPMIRKPLQTQTARE
jgi:glucose-1-phosphate thymidylyltransferase